VSWMLSQLLHFIAFESNLSINHMETGAIIISVDVDVGSKLLGKESERFCNKVIHNYLPESKLGEIEEFAVPNFARLLDELEIPATFAIRGQLTEINPCIINFLKDCKVKHDIGAHGYSHKCFTNLSEHEAEEELINISKGLEKYDIKPKSFVFPKNRIAHLSLLEKYGYKSYRGYAGFKHDKLCVEKHGQLYNVHSSFFLGRSHSPLFLKKIIDMSARRKLPCHLWFHPSDLGQNELAIQTRIERLLVPLLSYAKKKETEGTLRFETMASIVDAFESKKIK
jgi:hypothetical protein